jgi:hypothetical protein
MKLDFPQVHEKVLRAYVSFGGTQYFRAFRNEILKANGWEYSEYENECLVKLTDTSN